MHITPPSWTPHHPTPLGYRKAANVYLSTCSVPGTQLGSENIVGEPKSPIPNFSELSVWWGREAQRVLVTLARAVYLIYLPYGGNHARKVKSKEG